MKPRSDEAAVLEQAFAIVAREAFASIVSLTVTREGAQGVMKMPNPMRAQNPAAPPEVDIPLYPGPYSAVVLSADGWIATCTVNLWEFDKIKSVTAHLADGRDMPAQIVARDRYRLIAVLKVEATDLKPLVPAVEADLAVGRFALALGNPFGAERQEAPLFTRGIVSNLHRLSADFDAIQTDAGMNDALIGGALVSLEGKLLGISLLVNPERLVQFRHRLRDPDAGAFEGPPELKAGKNVEPGYIGISNPTRNKEGEIVLPVVTPDGPAGQAGLMNGDRVVMVDDRKADSFKDPSEFIEYLRSRSPGYEMKFKIKRGTEEKDITVVLGSCRGD